MGQIVRVAVAIPLLGASLALASAGVASAAPSVVGMTYDKAKEAVSNAGLSAEISTSTGTALQQGDCVVVSQALRAASTFGHESTPAKVLLSLNCNAVVASAGKPGNSAASPEGRAALKQQAMVQWLQTPDGQTWCIQTKQQHPEWFPIDGCPT
jgi:beta-lactam-binding protein with PASTA domain